MFKRSFSRGSFAIIAALGLAVCLDAVTFAAAKALGSPASPGSTIYASTIKLSNEARDALADQINFVLTGSSAAVSSEKLDASIVAFLADHVLKFSAVEVVRKNEDYVLYNPLVDLFVFMSTTGQKLSRVGFLSGVGATEYLKFPPHEGPMAPLPPLFAQRLSLQKALAETFRQDRDALQLGWYWTKHAAEANRVVGAFARILTSHWWVADRQPCFKKASTQFVNEIGALLRTGKEPWFEGSPEFAGVFKYLGSETFVFVEPGKARRLYLGVVNERQDPSCSVDSYKVIYFGTSESR